MVEPLSSRHDTGVFPMKNPLLSVLITTYNHGPYIAQAIAVADVLITLTHFKGHAAGVFGGAIKNLGYPARAHHALNMTML